MRPTNQISKKFLTKAAAITVMGGLMPMVIVSSAAAMGTAVTSDLMKAEFIGSSSDVVLAGSKRTFQLKNRPSKVQRTPCTTTFYPTPTMLASKGYKNIRVRTVYGSHIVYLATKNKFWWEIAVRKCSGRILKVRRSKLYGY